MSEDLRVRPKSELNFCKQRWRFSRCPGVSEMPRDWRKARSEARSTRTGGSLFLPDTMTVEKISVSALQTLCNRPPTIHQDVLAVEMLIYEADGFVDTLLAPVPVKHRPIQEGMACDHHRVFVVLKGVLQFSSVILFMPATHHSDQAMFVPSKLLPSSPCEFHACRAYQNIVVHPQTRFGPHFWW